MRHARGQGYINRAPAEEQKITVPPKASERFSCKIAGGTPVAQIRDPYCINPLSKLTVAKDSVVEDSVVEDGLDNSAELESF